MVLPLFFIADHEPGTKEITLDEDNSRHIVQVLRMKPGDALQLTDGKGTLLDARIGDDHKKKCRVTLLSVSSVAPPLKRVAIAISPLKNTSRFEWFLEKATEIGVSEIIPLLCERTERAGTKPDRLQNILVSAMLQSRQSWLPVLRMPTPFMQGMTNIPYDQRFIAHCMEAPRPTHSLASLLHERPDPAAPHTAANKAPSRIILIGPEGDFSPKEVESALSENFTAVTLGDNRLRTETAGVVAATLLCIG